MGWPQLGSVNANIQAEEEKHTSRPTQRSGFFYIFLYIDSVINAVVIRGFIELTRADLTRRVADAYFERSTNHYGSFSEGRC